MRRAGRRPIRCFLLAFSSLLTFFFSSLALSQVRPEAAPGPVFSRPTKVTGTVKAVKLLRSLVELSEEGNVGEDTPANVKVYSVKLRINTAAPVKAGETKSVEPGTEVNVVTRDGVNESFVGKKITGIIEIRGDTRRRKLLLTNISPVATKQNPQHTKNQEK